MTVVGHRSPLFVWQNQDNFLQSVIMTPNYIQPVRFLFDKMLRICLTVYICTDFETVIVNKGVKIYISLKFGPQKAINDDLSGYLNRCAQRRIGQ